jgi:hypothetical protein
MNHDPPRARETETRSKRNENSLQADTPPFQLSAVAIGDQRSDEPRRKIGFVTGSPSTQIRHQFGRPDISRTATRRLTPTATSCSTNWKEGARPGRVTST